MCCSSHGASVTVALQLQAAALPVSSPQDPKRLRYLGQTSLSLRGPFSARVYNLATDQRELAVDASDLEALLRTGLFEPA